MEYSVNVATSNSTSDQVETFLRSYEEGILNANNTKQGEYVDYNLELTFQKIESIASKLFYEIVPIANRKAILEYCLTLCTGKIKNVFTIYKPLDIPVQNKKEALKYFFIHLLIYNAELKNTTLLEETKYIKKLFSLSDGIAICDKNIFPIQSFSNLSNVDQICVRIDDVLSTIKISTTQPDLISLIGYLILLDVCSPYI